MRLAHVVTLLSPDAAYGGPLRVSLNQLTSLASTGDQVTLYAACRGYQSPPTELDGVAVVSMPARRVLPRTGFAGLSSPALLRRLWQDLPTFDVVQVHLARDLITLPAARMALRRGVPLLVQTHGMVDPSDRPLAAPLDRLLTRPVLRGAARVLYLTERERADLLAVEPKVRLAHLQNGIDLPSEQARPDSQPCEVLFLARLHPRKRASTFVRAAIELAEEFSDAVFTLVGPDEGEGAEVRRLIAASGLDRVRWEGPLPMERTLERMARATIYVLPSVDEPFPMTVLEAASLGLPVVVGRTCGLTEAVQSHQAGGVVDDSVDSLVATLRRLLSDQSSRVESGRRARGMIEKDFSQRAVTDELRRRYVQAIRENPQQDADVSARRRER